MDIKHEAVIAICVLSLVSPYLIGREHELINPHPHIGSELDQGQYNRSQHNQIPVYTMSGSVLSRFNPSWFYSSGSQVRTIVSSDDSEISFATTVTSLDFQLG